MRIRSAVTVVLLTVSSVLAQPAPTTQASSDPFVLHATVFVKAMRFADADKTERVIKLTADYLRQLRHVIDQRNENLKQLGENAQLAEVDQHRSDAWQIGRNSSVALRDALVVQLDTLMTPFQVERIKDGMTTDWYPRMVELYDQMVPEMTYAQRAHIAGLLTEMRENAMLELDAGPQEQWANKYRGIINNYLSAQGHNFSALSKAYEEKRKAK